MLLDMKSTYEEFLEGSESLQDVMGAASKFVLLAPNTLNSESMTSPQNESIVGEFRHGRWA